MKKENKEGITIISLIITIILLLILASLATYNGIQAIKNAKLTKFTTEMKIMQSQINSIYEKYKNGDTIKIDDSDYTKDQILEIGDDNADDEKVTTRKNQLFNELNDDPEAGIKESEQDDYKYWDNELIKKLEIEGVEGSFFVNLNKRSIISYEGFEYRGRTYYTVNQLPDNLYNVEYQDANTEKPTFSPKVEQNGENKWQISISDIQYNGYINKWQVQYKPDGQEFWSESDELSFIVSKQGQYKIKIVNGTIESEEQTVQVNI